MKQLNLLLSTVLLVVITACSSTKHVDTITPNKGSQALFDHTWELEYMSGIRIAFEVLFPENKPSLTFDDVEKVARGNAGCNGYAAVYKKEADNISFADPGPSTLMYCGEGEQQFLNMMKKINRYSVDENGKLNLMIDDIPMMRFRKID